MLKKELLKKIRDLEFELERFKIFHEAVEVNLMLDDKTAIYGIRDFYEFDKNLYSEDMK